VPQLSQEGVGFSPCYGATRTQRFFRGYSAAGSQFFRDHQVSMGRNLLQSERNAELLVDVLRSLVLEKKFEVHDFVIMPDHVHLLLTVGEGMTIERQCN
jgi:putative transposase